MGVLVTKSPQGVLFSVMMGLWVLLLAEILHYVLHYQVAWFDRNASQNKFEQLMTLMRAVSSFSSLLFHELPGYWQGAWCLRTPVAG